MITNTTPYSSSHIYSSYGGQTTAPQPQTRTRTGHTVTENQGVKVSLSPEVQAAKLREVMGLNPTGRLKLEDFKSIANTVKKEIESSLSQAMADLGIDSKQQVSLSLDADSKLSIKESFPNKSKLLKTLKEDETFTASFTRLSANRQVIDYSSNLTEKNISLASFMEEDEGWDGIMSLARQYEANKTRGNSLEDLLRVSQAQSPYTYVHNESV